MSRGEFGSMKIKFSGRTISREGMTPNEENAQHLLHNMKMPKQIRRLIVFCSFLKRLFCNRVKNYYHSITFWKPRRKKLLTWHSPWSNWKIADWLDTSMWNIIATPEIWFTVRSSGRRQFSFGRIRLIDRRTYKTPIWQRKQNIKACVNWVESFQHNSSKIFNLLLKIFWRSTLHSILLLTFRGKAHNQFYYWQTIVVSREFLKPERFRPIFGHV